MTPALPPNLPPVACIAAAVYGEARGEPLRGQVLVARVIRNRVTATRWPGSACDVVQQASQFAFMRHRFEARETWQAQLRAWARAFSAAIEVTVTPPHSSCGEATYFVEHRVQAGWPSRMRRLCRVGNHVFLADRGP